MPSPQSIINSFSLILTIWEVGKCLSVGSALPHPRMVTSNFSIAVFEVEGV